jgi:hypothetical protein
MQGREDTALIRTGSGLTKHNEMIETGRTCKEEEEPTPIRAARGPTVKIKENK